MIGTNLISTIVKILENPIQISISEKNSIIKCRVQFPQMDSNQIIDLVFWGSLGKDFKDYYKQNDYVIVEGYLSVENNKNSKFSDSTSPKSERIKITVLKVYPFILS